MTASAHKFRLAAVLVITLVVALALAASAIAILGDKKPAATTPGSAYRCFEPTPDFQSGRRAVRTRCRLNLEIADSEMERVEGLSDRDELPVQDGLLFIFDTAGQHCIWMKDMRFPIDIVWLDEDKRIVMIKSEVSPETYPDSFCNEQPAKYVIEINARVSSALRLRTGQRVSF